MAEKLTLEVVREFFEIERGFKLLDTEYKNSEFPMKYICVCGNESKMSYKNAKKGRSCAECGNKKRSTSKQIYTYRFILKFFQDEGCILLEDSYPGNPLKKLRYVCSCGTETEACWSTFMRGHRCKKCGYKKIGDKKRKYTMGEVSQLFSEQGKTLLETGLFENSHQSLRYVCKCGNESRISLNNFLRGSDCAECKRVRLSEVKKDPDITDDEREIKRQYPEYAEWRKAVYERDAYTCQCCGIRGVKLNAHHIRNYADCRELRTEVSNGTSLCVSCHYAFHSRYGSRNTDSAQLHEFLRSHKGGA